MAKNGRPGGVGGPGGVGAGGVGPAGPGAAGRPGGIQPGGRAGTYNRPNSELSQQADNVRNNYGDYDHFTPGWAARNPGAWYAAGWATADAWRWASYASLSSMYGYPAQPAYYDYGTSAVDQGGTMYVNGDAVGSSAEYSQQASNIADTGRNADSSKDDAWTSLGVFSMVSEQETSSSNVFQLALNKSGVIRGSYYNALTDSTETVFGSVDPKSRRAAWTVGDQKSPVYEAGLANLTKDQTTMLVHYANGKSSQLSLVRIEQPEATTGN